MTTNLVVASDNAAAEVLRARSALAHACRYADAEAISAARQELQEAKAARLRADADLIQSGFPEARRRVLVTSYAGDAHPTAADHVALEYAQREAVGKFLQANPRDPEADQHEPSWDRATRRAYAAMLAAAVAAHAALGCQVDAPCRKAPQ